jgi:hypothetical protein
MERGEYLEVAQWGDEYETPGATITDENSIFPGEISGHVGLARVAAAEANIGVVEVRFLEEDGASASIHYGAAEEWETAI